MTESEAIEKLKKEIIEHWIRNGHTEEPEIIIRSARREYPDDPDFQNWIIDAAYIEKGKKLAESDFNEWVVRPESGCALNVVIE